MQRSCTPERRVRYPSTGNPPDGTAFTEFLAGLNDCQSSDGVAVTGGYAGHCDWRLPQTNELTSMLLRPYPCGTDPCIDQIAFGPTNANSYYWSATSEASFPAAVRIVHLFSGYLGFGMKGDGSSGLRCRAVRSGL